VSVEKSAVSIALGCARVANAELHATVGLRCSLQQRQRSRHKPRLGGGARFVLMQLRWTE
jgi:hypothetical protein